MNGIPFPHREPRTGVVFYLTFHHQKNGQVHCQEQPIGRKEGRMRWLLGMGSKNSSNLLDCRTKVFMRFLTTSAVDHSKAKVIIMLTAVVAKTETWIRAIYVFVSATTLGVLVASNPSFPFWILSRSSGESCETKSGTESLGSRLVCWSPGG